MVSELDAFVLAGGASVRFGEDKALADVDGRRLVDRVVDAVAGARSVRVVRRAGQRALTGHSVLVGDEGRDRHPLWGVAVALEAAQGPRALVVPCDLVALSSAHVTSFVTACEGGEGVAWDGDRVHPLLAVLFTHRAAAVRRAAREGSSVHAFVAGLPRVALPRDALRNLNRRPAED